MDRILTAGETFADRYEIRGQLGRGAFGVVYDATDLANSTRVALKLLRANRISLSSSRWREAKALRRLNVPGVARLLDEGVFDETPFVAMEFIDGEPFPQPNNPVEWDELRPLVVRFLEILSLVHVEGVVHGDLKPSNVMIADGDVVLLDFGLATRITANEYESGEGSRGTPIYMAPEVFADKPRSARSDLFAVGTMIFEALTGRPFYLETSLISWVRRVSTEGPPKLATVLEDAPEEACTLVDALLRVDPFDRPGSATEALQLMRDPDTPPTRWLGPKRYLPLLEAMQNRTSIDVVAPRGMGGRSTIDAAVRHFRRDGGVVHELGPGDRPFESLLRTETLEIELPGGLPLEEMERVIGERLFDRLERGEVVVASLGIDDWTASLLKKKPPETSVIRRRFSSGPNQLQAPDDAVDARAETLVLRPYDESQLQTFFAGPETALHLASGPARLLWERTLGYPADVFEELDAWVRFGMCHIEKDLVHVTPRALQVLRQGLRPRAPLVRSSVSDAEADILAWIRLGEPLSTPVLADLTEQSEDDLAVMLTELADRRLVRHSSRGWSRVRDVDVLSQREPGWLEEARLALIERSDDPELAFRLALVVGDEMGIVEGVGPAVAAREARADLSGAQSAYRQAVTTLESMQSHHVRDVLLEWGEFALWRSSAEVTEEVLWAWKDHDPRFRRLLEASRACRISPGEEVAESLVELGPFEDPILEMYRLFELLNARRWYYEGDQSDVLARLDELADEVDEDIRPRVFAAIALKTAFDLYGKGDYAGAARANLEAAELTDTPRRRLSLIVNGAWGLVDTFEYAEARDLAEKQLEDSATLGQPDLELQFVTVQRFASYRMGELPMPSDDVIAAALEIGYQPLTTAILLCEAAISWRRGDRRRAVDVASRGAQKWHAESRDWPSLLVTHLHAFLAGTSLEKTPAEKGREACPFPRLKAQMLGFASYLAEPEVGETMRAEARDLVPAEHHGHRLECFAIDEIDELDQIGRDHESQGAE